MKGANSPNVNVFIRGLYSSLLIKMFVIMAAIFIYISLKNGEVNTGRIVRFYGDLFVIHFDRS